MKGDGRKVSALLGAQLVLLLAVSGAFLLDGTVSGYSALAGGLIFYAPHAWFTLKIFSQRESDDSSGQAFHLMWMAEVSKLGLTVVLFAAAFMTLDPLNAEALLLTFAVMAFSNWLALLALR